MSEIPNYVPAHKMPCWLSSEDVKATIVALANTGADKAVCWDMTQAIYGLCENAKPAAHIHPCGHCGKLECDGDCQPVLPEREIHDPADDIIEARKLANASRYDLTSMPLNRVAETNQLILDLTLAAIKRGRALATPATSA